MAVKRNRWLVITVLVVAVGALLAASVLPFFIGQGNQHSAATPSTQPIPGQTDAQAELAARAQGYEQVLEREPDNQVALEGLVEARIQLGDLQGVIEPLEKLAELQPDVPDYRVLLGQAKQEIGDLEGAAQSYRTVLTTNPGNMNALQGLVALLFEQGRPQAARGLLQDTLQNAVQANEVNPGAIDVTSVKLLLAQVYVTEENFDEALRLYDEIIPEASGDFRPLLAKALVLREVQQPAEAAVLFKEAEELAPAQFKDQIRMLAASEAAGTPETVTGEDASESEADEASTESEPATEDDDAVE
ncbi:MAG: tetratricopeptide repeat protein [Cyanobacteria bacterium P01_H01_bin.58]